MDEYADKYVDRIHEALEKQERRANKAEADLAALREAYDELRSDADAAVGPIRMDLHDATTALAALREAVGAMFDMLYTLWLDDDASEQERAEASAAAHVAVEDHFAHRLAQGAAE